MWVETDDYVYALTCPNGGFTKLWEESLDEPWRKKHPTPRFQDLSGSAVDPPSWWPDTDTERYRKFRKLILKEEKAAQGRNPPAAAPKAQQTSQTVARITRSATRSATTALPAGGSKQAQAGSRKTPSATRSTATAPRAGGSKPAQAGSRKATSATRGTATAPRAGGRKQAQAGARKISNATRERSENTPTQSSEIVGSNQVRSYLQVQCTAFNDP